MLTSPMTHIINTDSNLESLDLKNEKFKFKKNDFWWDIDNDFMFWVNNKEFTTKFNQEMNIK